MTNFKFGHCKSFAMILLKPSESSFSTQSKLNSPSIKGFFVHFSNSIKLCFATAHLIRDPVLPSDYVISLLLCRV